MIFPAIVLGGQVLAGFLFFRSWNARLAEAAAYALLLPLMGFSFSARLAAMTGFPLVIPAWRPGNARLFTIFFAVGGYFVAFLLPPWRLSRRQRSLLQIVSGILFFHVLLA